MTHDSNTTPNRRHSRGSRWKRPASAVFVFVLFAGMLFWTKLRLVSDIPRSAYAVPKEEQPEPDGAIPENDSDLDEEAAVIEDDG